MHCPPSGAVTPLAVQACKYDLLIHTFCQNMRIFRHVTKPGCLSSLHQDEYDEARTCLDVAATSYAEAGLTGTQEAQRVVQQREAVNRQDEERCGGCRASEFVMPPYVYVPAPVSSFVVIIVSYIFLERRRDFRLWLFFLLFARSSPRYIAHKCAVSI